MRRIVLLVLAIIALIALAGYLGVQAGQLISERKAEKARIEYSETVLKRMGTLKVGDLLPEHEFVSFSGDSVMLSSLINRPTVVIFTEAECKACEEQSQVIKSRVATLEDYGAFLFITSGYPQGQLESNKRGETQFRFLMDKNSEYTNLLKVNNSPLSIFVDGERRIRSVFVGQMDQETISEAIEKFRAAGTT